MSVFVLVLGGRVEVDSLGGEVHVHDLLILLDLDDYLFFEDLFRVVLVLVCEAIGIERICLLYTSPSPRDRTRSRMPSSA